MSRNSRKKMPNGRSEWERESERENVAVNEINRNMYENCKASMCVYEQKRKNDEKWRKIWVNVCKSVIIIFVSLLL